MSSRNVRATTAGLLFIAATATSLIATAFLGSLLDGPGFLAAVGLHQDRQLTAALFQLIAAFTSAAIAVTLYPVLREHAAAMALAAVAFRLIEVVFYALSAAGTMILVSLSGQLTVSASAHARRLTWYETCATRPAAWASWPSTPEPRCTTSSSTGPG
jgi:Domain of unknown function (DUF4386)